MHPQSQIVRVTAMTSCPARPHLVQNTEKQPFALDLNHRQLAARSNRGRYGRKWVGAAIGSRPYLEAPNASLPMKPISNSFLAITNWIAASRQPYFAEKAEKSSGSSDGG
jgi:hypothetical protein